MAKALLFSGGIDSTALAYMERPEILLFINYGQLPAEGELRASQKIAERLELSLETIACDLRALGSGALVGKSSSSSRPEFWPYRNQALVTLAAMALGARNLDEILIGTVVSDRHHPDGTPEFLDAISQVLTSQGGPPVRAPASRWSSRDLLHKAGVPLSILDWTFSCHSGAWACGQCNGCRKHLEVVAEADDRAH